MTTFAHWWIGLSFARAGFWLCVWTLAAYFVARAFDAFARTGNRTLPPPDPKCQRNGVESVPR